MKPVTLPCGPIQLAADLFLPDPLDWPPLWPAVIVLHGFGSNRASHREYGAYLSARGIAVLTVDQRGHGDSQGRMDAGMLDDVGVALAFVSALPGVDPHRIAVRGASMGGNVAIRSAVRFQDLAAVIAICPASEPMLIDFVESGRAESVGRDTGNFRLDEAGLMSYLRAGDLRQAIGRISPRPLLLIQARGDLVVPWQSTKALYDLAGEPRELRLLDGGDHRSAQHDPEVHAHEVSWLRQAMPAR